MDIKKMLEAQKKLDEKILNGRKIYEHPQLLAVALVVEASELANELQFFKYWKKNKIVNRENVLNGVANCLPFALSICNTMFDFEIKEFEKEVNAYVNHEKLFYPCPIDYDDESKLDAFQGLIQGIVTELEYAHPAMPANCRPKQVAHIFIDIIIMGGLCGFTVDEMEKAYYERQEAFEINSDYVVEETSYKIDTLLFEDFYHS